MAASAARRIFTPAPPARRRSAPSHEPAPRPWIEASSTGCTTAVLQRRAAARHIHQTAGARAFFVAVRACYWGQRNMGLLQRRGEFEPARHGEVRRARRSRGPRRQSRRPSSRVSRTISAKVSASPGARRASGSSLAPSGSTPRPGNRAPNHAREPQRPPKESRAAASMKPLAEARPAVPSDRGVESRWRRRRGARYLPARGYGSRRSCRRRDLRKRAVLKL